MALPGLGQAYNRKYWKMPIVYAGFAGLTFALVQNSKRHRCYKTAYRSVIDSDTTFTKSCNGVTSAGDLKTLRDIYKRYVDLSILGSVVWYALNIIDATVDAHLFEFDVSDNLSLRLQPEFFLSRNAIENSAGLKITLRL